MVTPVPGGEYFRYAAELGEGAGLRVHWPYLCTGRTFAGCRSPSSGTYPAAERPSGGHRQKVGLVQTFGHHPSLLVPDEPAGHLDPLMQRGFREPVPAFDRRELGPPELRGRTIQSVGAPWTPSRPAAATAASKVGQPYGWLMLTIHPMPNWSTHMPNSSPHICFSKGTDTVPP